MSKTFYGGQAVIDGVMMRGQKYVVTAVRKSDGKISVITKQIPLIYQGRLRQIPLVRGIIVLIEALTLGFSAAIYSARVALGEEDKVLNRTVWGMIVLAIAVNVSLFFILPLLLVSPIDPYIGSSHLSNLIDGLFRFSLFIVFLKVMGLFTETRRLFTYHGAEHKVVNAYEAGVPMQVEAVRRFGIAHVRCGTNLVMIVLVLALVVFAFLGRPPWWIRFLSRLALVPIIASVSYELLRLQATQSNNPLMRVLRIPSLAIQSLTTGEPEDDQLEVAIEALNSLVVVDTSNTPLASEQKSKRMSRS